MTVVVVVVLLVRVIFNNSDNVSAFIMMGPDEDGIGRLQGGCMNENCVEAVSKNLFK
jgi:hypothetical protein